MDKNYDPLHPAYLNENEHNRTRDLDEEDREIFNEIK
jgi:hypothetical protein